MSSKISDAISDYLGLIALLAGVAWVIALIARMLEILPERAGGGAGLPTYLFFVAAVATVMAVAAYYLLGSGSIPYPSYVVIKGTSVFATPGGTSVATKTLAPGMVIALVKQDGEWSLIAKNGENLGYIPTADLVPMS